MTLINVVSQRTMTKCFILNEIILQSFDSYNNIISHNLCKI